MFGLQSRAYPFGYEDIGNAGRTLRAASKYDKTISGRSLSLSISLSLYLSLSLSLSLSAVFSIGSSSGGRLLLVWNAAAPAGYNGKLTSTEYD